MTIEAVTHDASGARVRQAALLEEARHEVWQLPLPHSRKQQEDQSAAECGQPDQRDHERDIVICHAHQPWRKARRSYDTAAPRLQSIAKYFAFLDFGGYARRAPGALTCDNFMG